MGSWRTFILQSALLGAAVVLIGALAPTDARPWVAVCGAVALAFFVGASLHRRRQIMRLAQQIDQILLDGRRVDLANCREGDVAVLSNELAKMVARLDRANTLLEEERNALSDALADVSHQIRTPLTAAALMLPKIERTQDAQERREAVRQLEGMLDRVSWLVTSLLKIAKVDAGAIRVERKPVDVQELAHRAVEPLLVSFDLHDISFVCQVQEGATFVGDALWTTEALENILKNCAEHTPDGGTVTLAATEDALATRITVTDAGPGFAPEDLPRLFDRFYRGQNVTQGFGIGLALARALVSVQGGTLTAANAPEGGAQFVLAFPKLVV